jgi:small-conductance mechanosensitive channel
MPFLTWTFLNNSVATWIAALLTFILILGFLVALRNHLLVRIIRLTHIQRMGVDELAIDLIANSRYYFLYALAFYSSSLVLNLPDRVEALLRTGMVIVALLQVAVWGGRLINHTVTQVVARRQQTETDNTAGIKLLGLLARVAVWALVLLVIADNIPGFRVNTLITSLGIGGIAVAFALQRILGDLFASLSITLDKPFVEGDFIVIGEQQGTVEHIGLKSTRLRSLHGEQIVISNSDLLASRIQNFKRMRERRVTINLKISPKTPYEKLLRIPELVQKIIETQPSVRYGRTHFREVGESSFIYEIVYTMLTPDYEVYMDCQQEINLAILKVFQGEEIPFAFQA